MAALDADESVSKLEEMFQKTEDDIERVTSQLEADFALEKCEGQDQAAGQENDVPQDVLVQRLGEVKKEYSSLVREAEEVRKMQEEMSLFFQSQLMEACQMLQQLQTATGPEEGTTEEQEKPQEGEIDRRKEEEEEGAVGGEALQVSKTDTSCDDRPPT
ncbi:spindle and kinetochore-associated protein 2-like [Branchiostoma lanceolatum]|uniref:spindle and kinetochore-associated protein 2-like n=1 Tax=Branchiostoma lanceolatum TaxID=7740 RepID=UPI003455BF06